jgi:hypothetical protein
VAAEAIAKRLTSLTGEREQRNLLLVLESMGGQAKPAVPTLAAMLDSISNRLLVFLILRTLFFCGPAATTALPAVARCITRFDRDHPDIQEWAQRILRSNPQPAQEVLNNAIALANKRDGKKLDAIQSRLGGGLASRPELLAGFHKIPHIKRFVAIADILSSQGPSSVRGIEKALAMKSIGKGYAASSLKRAVLELELHVAVPLIKYSDKQTWLSLTEAGGHVLRECHAFLDTVKST